MTFDVAALLGLVQGVFMFVPVSSSSHLALTQHWLEGRGVPVPPPDSPEAIFVNLVLHVGTLVSIGIVMRARLANLATGIVSELRTPAGQDRPAVRFALMIILGTAVTGVLGLGIREIAPFALGSPTVIAIMLVLTGVILWWTDKARPGTIENPGAKAAIGVGIAQALALLPGLSRSGLTIAAGLALGMKRAQAAEFTFILAIPTILAATLVQALDILAVREPYQIPWGALGVGFLVSAASGTVALLLVLRLLYAARFRVFSLYVWALAAVVLALQVA
ncbi:undecaprenyl-diphosphate phosphatase [Cellulomonas bogoriensis]|uniref:Undecaprenyl-diphosphatase n=1 Tax=Cellulomonas bogoriensis 69B4 = DSM 16987 TaxID=1386082 RepID=A0A0A0C1I1_9CELL|nr:undecaprenyl-diphosphate phosphatase [Cellulomonas bogoriensis]KGM14050.1 UDP-diphosphatase [Cellulomonas bogoriensis 69B4 = DSM 16987]